MAEVYGCLVETCLLGKHSINHMNVLFTYRPHTGIMMPDKAVLYVCGIEDAEYRAEKVSVCNLACIFPL